MGEDGDLQPFGERPPAEVVDAARQAFDTAATGELLTLTFDSLVDGTDTSASYRLTFEGAASSAEAFISTAGDCSTVAIQAKFAAPVSIHMDRWGDDHPLVTCPVGDQPRFDSVPSGSVRLCFEDGDGHPIAHTDWFRI